MQLDALPAPEKRLRREDRFSFDCGPSLACFNTCCRNRDLLLTPYDILRLKRALGLDSDAFLARYALYRVDEVSGFPVLSIRLLDTPERACPFVRAEGCGVYPHRPTACRLFPLARATGQPRGGSGMEEFFFLLDTPGCLGRKEPRHWTVSAWLEAGDLAPYLESNNRMLDLLFHPKRDRSKPLDDDQLQMIIVACYSLDVFRQFAREKRLADALGVRSSVRGRWERQDEALLELGFAYLQNALF